MHENANTITPERLVNPALKFPVAAHVACRTLMQAKPWQGDFDRRFAAIGDCLRSLCEIYGVEPLQLVHVGSKSGCSGQSRIDWRLRRIVLTGRLSVVSMLMLFAVARRPQGGGMEAMRWAATLFKRRFPISFARCRVVGGLLVNDGRRDD